MTTLDAAVIAFRAGLHGAGIEDPAAETRILIGGLLGLERSDFLSKGDRVLTEDECLRVDDALQRRLTGEPPFRILGRRAFYGLDLTLSAATLEPRPDTEILVETVLEHLKDRGSEALSIVDLGTGTGAILLALLSELPAARGLAVDLAEGALATARENAALNGLLARFDTALGPWFAPVSGTFDVIVSNPPYIPSAVIATLAVEVRDHDPRLALDGGKDGLDAYRAIAGGAMAHLKPGGLVAVETGFDQRISVERVFVDCGFELIEARKDYGGNDRVQVFCRRG